MNVRELEKDTAIVEYIKAFTRHPLFLQVKDAFVSHSPFGGNDATGIILNAGRAGGAVYVFNELEKISETIPEKEKQKYEQYGSKDPDLEND